MLEVTKLRFAYPSGESFAFDLRLATKQCLVVLGPSGSGKSTLLNLIAGFLTPSAGDIRWHKKSLLGMPPAARPLSMLFQADNLFDHLDVWTNIALGVAPNLRLTPNETKLIDDVLAELGIAEFKQRRITTLSGGQQQRVALGRALVRSRLVTEAGLARSLLLLDEPFSALDPDTKAECLALVRRLVAEFGITAFLVTHDPDDASALNADIFRLPASAN